MRDARGWVLLVGLVVIVGVLLTVSSNPQNSPEHGSNSDAKNGTSAARLLAQSLGHGGDQLAGAFDLPRGGLLFVFTPTSPYTSAEAQKLHAWVTGGGVLVYASETGDDQLCPAHRRAVPSAHRGPTSVSGRGPVPGVRLVTSRRTCASRRRGLSPVYAGRKELPT